MLILTKQGNRNFDWGVKNLSFNIREAWAGGRIRGNNVSDAEEMERERWKGERGGRKEKRKREN